MKGKDLTNLVAGIGFSALAVVSGCTSGLPRIPSSSSWLPPYKKANVPSELIKDISDLSPKRQGFLKLRAEAIAPYNPEEALQIWGGLGMFDRAEQFIEQYSLKTNVSNETVIGYIGILQFYENKHEEKNNPLTEITSPVLETQ